MCWVCGGERLSVKPWIKAVQTGYLDEYEAEETLSSGSSQRVCSWLRTLTVAEVQADDDRKGQRRLRLAISGADSLTAVHTWARCSCVSCFKEGIETDRTSALLSFPSPFSAGLNCCFLKPALEVGASGIMPQPLTPLLSFMCLHLVMLFHLLCAFIRLLHSTSFPFFYNRKQVDDKHTEMQFNLLFIGERVHSGFFSSLSWKKEKVGSGCLKSHEVRKSIPCTLIPRLCLSPLTLAMTTLLCTEKNGEPAPRYQFN